MNICENIRPGFEVYLLLWFLTIWVPILLFTNYRINCILIFIEWLEILYMMFSFIPIIGDELRNYFSYFPFLSLNIQGCVDMIRNHFNFHLNDSNSQFIEEYPELLITLPIFLIFLSCDLKLPIKLDKIFRSKSFFMIWIQLIIQLTTIWAINNVIYSWNFISFLSISSFILSLLFLFTIIIFYYCWVINNSNNWVIWVNCGLMMKIKKSSFALQSFHSESLQNYIIASHLRKIILIIFWIFNLKGYLLLFYIGKTMIIF